MFKKISQGFEKFFTKERVFILVIFIVLVWGLMSYSGSKSMVVDKMTDGVVQVVDKQQQQTPIQSNIAPSDNDVKPNGYALQPVVNPADLLPKDQNSQWAALNPNSMTQGNVLIPDLLQAGYHIGLDTIGQTLRNANLQLRSDPVIPKQNIGPWNQSTIEADLGRVPLELGAGSR